jgi:hypothetical protein
MVSCVKVDHCIHLTAAVLAVAVAVVATVLQRAVLLLLLLLLLRLVDVLAIQYIVVPATTVTQQQ